MKSAPFSVALAFAVGVLVGIAATALMRESSSDEPRASPVIEVFTPAGSPDPKNSHELHVYRISTNRDSVQTQVLFEPPEGCKKWQIVIGEGEHRTIYTAMEK